MEFLKFLDESVTPVHTVANIVEILEQSGFVRLDLCNLGNLDTGAAYYVVRGPSVIAFRLPGHVSGSSRFRLALAHTDFPALKVAPNPDFSRCGVGALHTEVYGSPLFTSWLDRDLGYAGAVAYECGGKLGTRRFRGKKLFRIPQLAIHLNRGVNQDGLKLNPQVDLNVLWGAKSGELPDFGTALVAELLPGETLVDFDVRLFDAQPAAIGGFNDEWIYSGRLDNLSSCHSIVEAIASAAALEDDFQVACFFNHEEVGSTSREGAGGSFLMTALECVWERFGLSHGSLRAVLAESFALSIDMAHAVHPNHPEKHDSLHAPVLGGGIVLKTNSQRRYASDVESSARLRVLCERAGISLQTFITRNDMPCGSTVGPTVSANYGIPTVDIGAPMLSMHSIREMMAVSDHRDMTRLVKQLFCP